MPSYPSVHQIEKILQKGEGGPEGSIDHVDSKLQVIVNHQLASEKNGLDALQDDHYTQVADMMDFSKSDEVEIVRAIGSGDVPWVNEEVVATGKSRPGKKLNHECCFIVHSNTGRIAKFRAYYDSAPLKEHVEAHKQNGTA